jgi:aminoglycoside 6'-N-acetyltransferase
LTDVTFIPAAPAHQDLLERWDEQAHVIESDPHDDWNWGVELARTVAWREQWLALAAQTPIGFIQIIDPQQEESHYWGDIAAGYRAIDIWIGEADFLGKGYGTHLMQWAIERCFSDPTVHTILIDPLTSNTRAIRFYERLGFVFVRLQRFGEDHCHVYQLPRMRA